MSDPLDLIHSTLMEHSGDLGELKATMAGFVDSQRETNTRLASLLEELRSDQVERAVAMEEKVAKAKASGDRANHRLDKVRDRAKWTLGILGLSGGSGLLAYWKQFLAVLKSSPPPH